MNRRKFLKSAAATVGVAATLPVTKALPPAAAPPASYVHERKVWLASELNEFHRRHGQPDILAGLTVTCDETLELYGLVAITDSTFFSFGGVSPVVRCHPGATA